MLHASVRHDVQVCCRIAQDEWDWPYIKINERRIQSCVIFLLYKYQKILYVSDIVRDTDHFSFILFDKLSVYSHIL